MIQLLDPLQFAVELIERNHYTDAEISVVHAAKEHAAFERLEMLELALWCLSGKANRCVDHEVALIKNFLAGG